MIAIDSSTTAFYLAQEIVERRGLVVVTNGLRLATLLMEQSSARVLVLGGVLRRSAGSLVGPIGDVLSSRGRITKGFFGLVGLSTVHGLMDISAEEAQTKHVMAAACDEVHGLFDSTKITGFGLHPFAADRAGHRALDRRRGTRRVRRRLARPGRRGAHRGVPTSHRGRGSARAAPRRNTVIRSSLVRTPFPDKGVSMRPARKLSALVALGAAAALALTGCTQKNQADTGAASGGAGASAAATTYKVAFVPKLQGVPYFEAMNAGGQKAAAALGNVEWLYQGPTQADAAAQADIVRSYIQQKVNTLIVAPNDPDSMAPLLQQAKDAGIHVATADTDAPSSVREAFVNQATAEGIGQGLTDSLLTAMGGQGKYAIVSCGQTAENLNSWIEVQKSYTASKYPNAQIVDIVYAGEDQAKSTQMATDLMNAHPDLTGLVGECTSSAPGVAQAVRDANKVGQVFTVGLGTPQSMKPYLEDGSSTAAILWDVENLGYLTAWTGAQLAEGKQFAATNNVSPDLSAIEYDATSKTLLLGPPLAITKDNVDQFNY